MRRSSALVVILGLASARSLAILPRSASGDDLPGPVHRTIEPGSAATPTARELPTPWREPTPDASPPVAPAGPRDAEDDQGVPRITAPSRPRTPEFDPSTWDPKLPPLGHPIAASKRISLRTDPLVFGNFETFDAGPDVVAYVMEGNPVVEGENFLVKAERIVAWLQPSRIEAGPGLGAGPKANPEAGPTPARDAKSSSSKDVFSEAFIAIYAVGSVDLVTGTEAERKAGQGVAFRAAELYLNKRTSRALLIEPRFDTRLPMGTGPGAKSVPLHVRATTLRTLTDGYAVFEQGDVATSRSNDRMGIQVAVLTMEEIANLEAGKPTILGFHTTGGQRFSGRGIVGRVERLPVVYISETSFSELADFPVRPHATTGARSSLGRYAIVGASRRQKLSTDAYVDWLASVGGYTKRGPAAGLDLDWRMPRDGSKPALLSGAFSTYGVYDRSGKDRDGYLAGEGERWKAEFENRYDPTPTLRVDTEVNAFSDRGFNDEFFQVDARNHKDRETYARLRYLSGGLASALTVGARLRDFVTETLEQPSLSIWSESVPLGETSGPLRAAFDLSTAVSIARLARRFDDETTDEDYEALRATVSERVYAPFDVGDVRVSPYVGVRLAAYFDRTDGGEDVTRTALETGVRANLQLHRDYALAGGTWRLDGLRHVIDFDLGGYARALDPVDPSEVPFFDRVDLEEDRTEVFLEMRNRLETRRVLRADRNGDGGERGNATLADFRIRGSYWPDGVGPYGRRGPGEIMTWGMAEISPDRAWIRGESAIGLGGATFRHWSLGAQWSPEDAISAAIGVRHVQGEVLAPWGEVFGKWNEKWGARFNAIRDFDSSVRWNCRLSLMRFSDDHLFEIGASVRDNGEDVGIFVSFHPAIGGQPLTSPFDPREAIDYTP